MWQDFLHVCFFGVLPVLYILEWFKLQGYCEILLWISLAFLSALTLRVVNIFLCKKVNDYYQENNVD